MLNDLDSCNFIVFPKILTSHKVNSHLIANQLQQQEQLQQFTQQFSTQIDKP